MAMRWKFMSIGTVCVALARFDAEAQSTDARVVGRVTDQTSGAAVAGVVVEAFRGDAVVARGESGGGGEFALPAMEPGVYELRASRAGYYALSHPLELKPRDALRLTLALTPVAGVEERVEVRGAVPGIDPQRTGSSLYLTHDELESLPENVTRDLPTLAEYSMPGAIGGHDNFVHVRGNELSLHQFINGVSFLDNPHQHFFPGLSPQIFESVNMVTGGFPAEFGNRFGGILDITTRSGASMNGSGSASFSLGTLDQRTGAAEYGGGKGRFGYYFYGGAFATDRYLNPPEPDELHDHGHGGRGDVQLDYRGDKDFFRLLVTGGTSRFELPNTTEEQELSRDARRQLDSITTILSWQRAVSERTLFSAALYRRSVSDDILPTTDPVTSFAEASRETRSLGGKIDWYQARGIHQFKAGLDFMGLRLRESFDFDLREEGEGEMAALSFQGSDNGSVMGLYVQDRLSPAPNLTLDFGLRFDRFDIVETDDEWSPRVGFAYHFPSAGSVIRASYSRLFTPPPIEYVLLASYLGNSSDVEEERVGSVKPYRQHLFEVSFSQELRHELYLEAGVYHHAGENSFENSEIANTRLFVPTNFDRATATGMEIALELRPRERTGFVGRVQYALAKVEFEGPVSGGFPGEVLEPGEKVAPAFDQRHSLVANASYRSSWRDLEAGAILRYGSGTPIEVEGEGFLYLPEHVTVDAMARLRLWHGSHQDLDLEVTVPNLTDNVYQIAKESEFTPIQYAPQRSVLGELRVRF
jgi:outer membrane receptor protein involved in Fe transport